MSEYEATKLFGEYFWASGPLLIGSAKLQGAVIKRDGSTLKAIADKVKRDRVVATTLKGEQTLLFGVNTPSAWHQGKRGGVLVRIHGHSNRKDWEKLVATDPAHVPAGAWKLNAFSLRLKGDAARALIDPWVEHFVRPVKAGPRVVLEAGDWSVDTALLGDTPRLQVDLYRFRPKDEVPAATGTPKGAIVTAPAALRLEPATKKLAKGLTFVETEGGPVLVLPVKALKAWNGCYDADGEFIYEDEACDYDRACESKKWVLPVKGGDALVLDQESTAFFKRDAQTSYLLRWIGADEKAHVLQAALSASEKQWKRTKEIFTLKSSGGLAIIDSAERGADLKKPVLGALPPGRYAIDELEEFDGEIADGATTHGLMASALRLRKV